MSERIRLLLTALFILSLTGCPDIQIFPTTKPSTRYVDIRVDEVPPEQANCECSADGAKRFYIENVGSLQGEYKIFKTSHTLGDTNIKAPVQEAAGILKVKEKKEFQECSISKLEGGECKTSTTYLFNGKNYPSTVQETSDKLLMARVNSVDNIFNVDLPPSTRGDCLSKCLNGRGCNPIDVSAQRDAHRGSEIATKISMAKAVGRVYIKDIMAVTEGGKNPLNRSDFLFKDKIGYNYGDRGTIQGTYGKGKINISIPHALKLKYKVNSSESFSLIFSKSGTAPYIQFTSSEMKGLSGAIEQIDYFEGVYALEISSGSCFAIKVRK